MNSLQDAKRFRCIMAAATDKVVGSLMCKVVGDAHALLAESETTPEQEVAALKAAIDKCIEELKFEADRPPTVELPVEPTWTMLEEMEGVHGQQDSPAWYHHAGLKYKRLIKQGTIK